MPDAWEQCGFTEGKAMPLLYASMAPMKGLYAALHERGLSQSYDIDILESIGNLEMLDRSIATICTEYINHLSSTLKNWNWSDLCDATLNITGDDEIYTVERLMPQLSVIYARQRYVMINLLKVRYYDKYEIVRSFAVHTREGIGRTLDDAFSDYLEREEISERQESSSSLIYESHYVHHYSPNGHLDYEHYHFYRGRVFKFRKTQLTNAKMYVFVSGIPGSGTYLDTFETGMTSGWNKFKLDSSGEIDWPSTNGLTDIDRSTPIDETHYSGWEGYVYFDHSSTFQYYHDVDSS